MSLIDPMDFEQVELTRAVLTAVNKLDVPYVLGGAMAVNYYGVPWRNTKDLDIFLPPEDRHTVIDALTALGLVDYYAVWPYDREWIYRSHKGNKIIDVIWQSANRVGVVGADWRDWATPGEMAGVPTWFASPEDLIWLKAFIVQRERCDWPDILNLIAASEGHLQWQRLVKQFGPHGLLLRAVIDLFDWTCPQQAHYVPASIRQQLGRLGHGIGPENGRRSAPRAGEDRENGCRWRLLDSRPWFVKADPEEPIRSDVAEG
jgi:putative nucleotidyltransferase-like protein